MVGDELGSLIVSVLEAVRAQAGFVHDKVRDVLCMLDGRTRMIDSLVSFIFLRLEAELNFVDAVTEAKDWEVSSFNRRDSFLKLTTSSLIVCGDRDEVAQLLGSF